MRLTCEPLRSTGNGIVTSAGFSLWTSTLDWRCRDRRLAVQIIALESLELPSHEPSEPLVGALARIVQNLRAQSVDGRSSLLALVNPAEALGENAVALAEGVRLFAITTAADEACWDAALTLGMPIYGVRDVAACSVTVAKPASMLSALGYGNFVCESGLSLASFDENGHGVSWRTDRDAAQATVIARGGFEVARVPGRDGAWVDRGNEGYVRVVVRSGNDGCWTQPRFIGPNRGGTHA